MMRTLQYFYIATQRATTVLLGLAGHAGEMFGLRTCALIEMFVWEPNLWM